MEKITTELNVLVGSIQEILDTDTVVLKHGNFSGAFTHIVRCRDCKHYKEDAPTYYTGDKFHVSLCQLYDRMMRQDDYCSRGERNGMD